jgi:hypothetical protein
MRTVTGRERGGGEHADDRREWTAGGKRDRDQGAADSD